MHNGGTTSTFRMTRETWIRDSGCPALHSVRNQATLALKAKTSWTRPNKLRPARLISLLLQFNGVREGPSFRSNQLWLSRLFLRRRPSVSGIFGGPLMESNRRLGTLRFSMPCFRCLCWLPPAGFSKSSAALSGKFVRIIRESSPV